MEQDSRFYVVRDGIVRRDLELYAVNPARVTMAYDAQIKMALRGTFLSREGVDLLHDHIQAALVVDGQEQSIGEFVVTTCQTRCSRGQELWELEAYDQTYLIKRQRQETRRGFGIQRKYLEVIEMLLTECGITRIDAEVFDANLQTYREWEIGEETLTIINTLLSEMSFSSLWFDSRGYARITRCRPPQAQTCQHHYCADELSVLKEDCVKSWDIFDAKNVFVAMVSLPGAQRALVATSENDDIRSPISTVNLGRLMAPILQLDNIASRQALQDYVDMVRFESMLCTETVRFQTANRIHGIGELVAVEHPHLHGIFQETAWEMVLGYGGTMTHTAKRVMI